jgi:hypothetical protein
MDHPYIALCLVMETVNVSKNEYQAGILPAQGHSEETAICPFDNLEETEAMDGNLREEVIQMMNSLPRTQALV